MWTLLKPQQPGVVAQVPLLPALPVQHEPGSRITGQDEAAAINHERQGDQTVHLPRVSLSGSGIGKETICELFWYTHILVLWI